MTIKLSDKTEIEPKLTLAGKIGMDGRVRWRDMTACTLTFEDNPEEYFPVEWVKKRKLHVVTDQMVRAKASMVEDETKPGDRLSGTYILDKPITGV